MPVMTPPKFASSLHPPVTRQYIYKLRDKGVLVVENKRIDTDHPTNAAWLKGYPYHDNPKPPGTKTTAVPGVRVHGVPDPNEELDEERVENILERLAAVDLFKVKQNEANTFKAIEAALKTRQDRQIKRKELIDRRLVQTVFSRLYQIDTNELRPIGSMVAPEIAGVFSSDDPEKILEAERIIDERVMRVLGHIKRTMADALTGWGEAGL